MGKTESFKLLDGSFHGQGLIPTTKDPTICLEDKENMNMHRFAAAHLAESKATEIFYPCLMNSSAPKPGITHLHAQQDNELRGPAKFFDEGRGRSRDAKTRHSAWVEDHVTPNLESGMQIADARVGSWKDEGIYEMCMMKRKSEEKAEVVHFNIKEGCAISQGPSREIDIEDMAEEYHGRKESTSSQEPGTWIDGGNIYESYTAYKRKAVKVKPVDYDQSDGSKPAFSRKWKEDAIREAREKGLHLPREPYDCWFIPKFSTIEKGSRLTPERIEKMNIGQFLTIQEKELLLGMLFNREQALAWDFTEKGIIKESVAEPPRIRTVPHQAWQQAAFQPPKALHQVAIDMVRQRLNNGVLEPSYGPYRNPWFLVKKDNGKYRLINAAMNINRVTIRDANMPPNVEDFVDEFAALTCCSLIDFFSGYDQVALHPESRDLTAFMTPLGLMRCTTLPQGATNSVAQFVRIVTDILMDHIPHRCAPFLDDIGVKGPRTDYNNKEVAPGIRQYVLEHLQWMDAVLADLERAGATISGEKSQFCLQGLKMVGFVCDTNGKHPESLKVIKILEWTHCETQKEVRAFLGICVYYRIFIENFATIAEPLFRLLRQDVEFNWGEEQHRAMGSLQGTLTTAPALKPIDYGSKGNVILAVDASNDGWGAVLMQEDPENPKLRHPVRYESGIWNNAEKKYDACKLECRALMKALKKNRAWLYAWHFKVEIDANTLVAQLNRTATDVPGALIVRWLAWIRNFDFEVKHIPGKKHTAADGLSRKPPGPSDLEQAENEEDIDAWVDGQINAVEWIACPVETVEEQVLEDGYSEYHQMVGQFLLNGMQRPEGLKGREWTKFRQYALKFLVRGGHLFKRATKNVPLRRVVDSEEERENILNSCHEEQGHPGIERTYRLIADRYWWEKSYGAIKEYVLKCHECQAATKRRLQEGVFPTCPMGLFSKINVDIAYMPELRGYKYLVVGRDDFSGWVEARPLRQKESRHVAKFIYEDFICRHPCPQKIVVDGGTENQGFLRELAEQYKLGRVQISPYNPRANGQVERGHAPIINSLTKMRGSWLDHLPAVLRADRATVRRSTGHSPHRLLYGCELTLAIELAVPTYATLPFEQVSNTEDLIALRARQFEKRDDDVTEALSHLQRMREESAEYFDENNQIRHEPLQIDDYVLLWDSSIDTSYARRHKFAFRWLGPYQIHEADNEKGTFKIRELNGAVMSATVAGSRLKKYHPRGGMILQEVLQENTENAPESDSDEEQDEEQQTPEQYAGPVTRSANRQLQNEEVRQGLQPAVRRLQAVVIPPR